MAPRRRYAKQLSGQSVWSPSLDAFHTKDNTKVTAKEDVHYVIREHTASHYSRSYFKLKHAGVCSCPCSHEQKAYILETAFLCLFVTAQGILCLAARGTILLQAPPGPQALWTVGRKWGGKWDARFVPGAWWLDGVMRQWSLWVPASWGATHLCRWQNGGCLWERPGNTHKDRTDQGCVSHFCARLAILSHLFLTATWYSHFADEKTKAQSIHDLQRWHNQWLSSGVSTGLSDYKLYAYFAVLLPVKLSLHSCHIGILAVPQPSHSPALELSYLFLFVPDCLSPQIMHVPPHSYLQVLIQRHSLNEAFPNSHDCHSLSSSFLGFSPSNVLPSDLIKIYIYFPCCFCLLSFPQN